MEVIASCGGDIPSAAAPTLPSFLDILVYSLPPAGREKCGVGVALLMEDNKAEIRS